MRAAASFDPIDSSAGAQLLDTPNTRRRMAKDVKLREQNRKSSEVEIYPHRIHATSLKIQVLCLPKRQVTLSGPEGSSCDGCDRVILRSLIGQADRAICHPELESCAVLEAYSVVEARFL
ncbi:hypothetical protein J6590_012019 [Homalodisca vitripennis]|nr:hypothetical protein J6590_012019 [Homalodisca vitripennis]